MWRKRIYAIVLTVILNFIAVVFLFIFFEGTLGVINFFHIFRGEGMVAEGRHTEHDPLVGWINKPDITVHNMYGPGNDLTILPDRTRLTATPATPSAAQVICSGDSFTLGYGVGDLEAWCSRLSEYGWRGINMGQGGYGLDQSYLLYQAKAGSVDHAAHVAAFTLYDFDRVFSDDFLGYGKPYFRLDKGKLINMNYPVRPPGILTRFTAVHRRSFESLHLYQAVSRITRATMKEKETEPYPILDALMRDIYGLTRRRNADFVLVLLPAMEHYDNRTDYDQVKYFLSQIAGRDGFPFVDAGDRLFALDKDEYQSMFIPRGTMTYSGSDGHYSKEGNARVAAIIADALDKLRKSPR